MNYDTVAFAGTLSAVFLSSHQGFAPEVESKGWSSSRKEAGMSVFMVVALPGPARTDLIFSPLLFGDGDRQLG